MEIQCAVLCIAVGRDKEKGHTLLVDPIGKLDAKTFEDLPVSLWICFMNGEFGKRYDFEVSVTTDALGEMWSGPFDLTWRTKKLFLTTVAAVKIPPLVTGFYTITISTNSHQFPLKIWIDQKKVTEK